MGKLLHNVCTLFAKAVYRDVHKTPIFAHGFNIINQRLPLPNESK